MRFFPFLIFYFLQGSVLAFLANFHKPFLANQGVANGQIAIITGLMIWPFILKIGFAYISDSFLFGSWGKRIPPMILGLVVAAISYCLAAQINPGAHFSFYASVMIAGSLGLALFDAALDGFAIDTIPTQDEGLAQAAMVAGKALGYLVLSQVFAWVIDSQGPAAPFLILAGLAIAILPLVFYFARAVGPSTQFNQPMQANFRNGGLLKGEVGALLAFSAYALLYSVVSFGIDGNLTYFLAQEFAGTPRDIGNFGSLRGLGSLAGAGAAGLIFYSRGIKATSSLLPLILLCVAGATLGNLGNEFSILGIALAWGFVWGIQETSFVTLAMNLSRRRLAATAFAAFMIVSNIGTSLGEWGATTLIGQLGFRTTFQLLGAFNVIAIAFLLVYFSLIKRASPSRSG